MSGTRARQYLSRLTRQLVLGLCMFAPSIWAAEQTYKLGHMFAPGSIPDQAATKFAELVAEKSRGAIAITIHPGGILGDERENVAQLSKGILDFAVTGDVVVSNVGDKYRVVNMPFIYRDPQHALKTYESELGKAIRNNIRAEGIEALSWHYVGTRMLTANRPIRNVADLKGLQLRLPQDSAWITTWQALGASTKQVQFTELASALKMGRVEAQENPPNFIRTSRLFEHQKYLITTNHLPQRQMILVADSLFKKLPEQKRSLFRNAAQEASAWTTRRATALHKADLLWLTGEGGMSLIEFDDRGLSAAIAGVPATLAGQDGQKIFDQIRTMP